MAELIGNIVILIIAVFISATIMSLPIMLLWDWLMPYFFGLKEITWFQAWGMMFLCGLLFKSHKTA